MKEVIGVWKLSNRKSKSTNKVITQEDLDALEDIDPNSLKESFKGPREDIEKDVRKSITKLDIKLYANIETPYEWLAR